MERRQCDDYMISELSPLLTTLQELLKAKLCGRIQRAQKTGNGV